MDIINPYIHGGESEVIDGFGKGSRHFDGLDDKIDFGDVLDSVFSGTGKSWTTTAWVKIDNLYDDYDILTKWNYSGSQRSFVIRLTSTGAIAVSMSSDGTTSNRWGKRTPTGIISANTWYHVSVTYDQSSTGSYLRFWINGTEQTSLTDYFISGGFSSIYNSSSHLQISGWQADNTTIWEGNITDVRIYNTEIPSSAILDLSNFTDYQTNLVGHWIKYTPSLLDHAGNNDGTNYGSKFSYDNPSPAVEFGSMSRSFNGTSDHIDIGDVLDSVFAGTGKKFTLSAWIKTTTLEDTDFLGKYNLAGQRSFLCRVLSDGNLAMVMSGNGNFTANRWGRQTDTAPISADTWHHVAITYDHTATGDYLRMWVDGVEDTTLTDWNTNGTFTSIFDGTAQLRISGIEGNLDTNWGGNIADVRLYDTDLSSTDISDLYNGTDIQTNLVGHWLTNNDDVKDYAGVNDGTNNGSTYSYDNPNALVEYGGASRSFNGTSDHLDLGDSDDFSFGDGSNDSPFSVSVWVKMDDATNFRVMTKFSTTAVDWEWQLSCAFDDNFYFLLYSDAGVNRLGRRTSTNFTAQQGDWLHVVATYDGSSSSSGIKIYVTEQGGTPARVDTTDANIGTYTAMDSTPSHLRIGRIGDYTTTSAFADGNIADARLYDKELTSTEAYELAKGVDHRANLIGQWLTNSDDVEDKAGTNDGTNVGSTYSTDSPL